MPWQVPPLLAILAVVEPSGAILRPLRDGRIWLLGLALGAFVPLYTLGVAHADPNTAAIVGSTGPAVAAVVGWACFGLPFDRSMVPAIVLAMAGGIARHLRLRRGRRRLRPARRRAADLARLCLLGLVFARVPSAGWAQRSQLRISCVTMVPGTVVSVAVYLAAALAGSADLLPAAPTGPCSTSASSPG